MSITTTVIAATLCVMVRMSVEVTWTTEELYTTCCEGEDKLLMWKYSLEENERVVEHKWFYKNTKLICHYSEFGSFKVAHSYKGRVEQSGTTGILLKKMSSDDTGHYTLYAKLAGVHTKNFQTIVLSVYEPPTYQCKPNITIHSKYVISCSTNSCGRQQLSPEWRVLGERDPVGNQSYLNIEFSWKYETVFCCPQGPNMKCHDGDMFTFCVSTLSVSTDKNIPASYYLDTDNNISVSQVASLGSFVTIIVFLAISVYCWRKLKRLVTKYQNENMDESHSTRLQDPKCCAKNMNEGLRVVNNVNIDPDVFNSLLDSKRTMRDLRKENRKLLRRLHHIEHSLQFPQRQKLKDASRELTITISGKTDGNDTDTSDVITDGNYANLEFMK